ncbi:lipopolysaccharide assembly protein LapB [Alicyclobacillus sp. SP_1]|uniref:tetratricopeptide repeat protein n=1 Tax=Alicyclobacillus sp. SP_1 TaxID=2942475 RepID=UPI0021586886|nr:tetratricopeptide repeat protein [Alicyclobacillus sp. SP_1]
MDVPKKNERRRRYNNVIPIHQSAQYFHERGLKYLQKNELEKALRAFRKTVEYEPRNPINYCNLAGVLSELGDFSESNKVLFHVLHHLAPDMAECQFYLANNYAHLGEYDSAEEHVLRYLDADPDGEYAIEAEEMLELLLDEFGGGAVYRRWEQERLEVEQAAAKQDGRHLLEQGEFESAIVWLEKLIRDNPDNHAAKNNLSLAYFYTGQSDKAMRMSESVLETQPDNLHAICNYAVFMNHRYGRERALPYFETLQRVFPLNYDLAMKVGTTLGLAGLHAEALQYFLRIARIVVDADDALRHSIAAAAANAGRADVARVWWRKMGQEDEMKSVADYYLRLLDAAVESNALPLAVSYQYELPLQMEYVEMRRRLQEMKVDDWKADPLFRASLAWGLRHGSEATRQAIIRALVLAADDESVQMLRTFLRETVTDSRTQSLVLLALVHLQAQGEVEVRQSLGSVTVRLDEIPAEAVLGMNEDYQTVWHLVDAWLSEHHHHDLGLVALRTWVVYLQTRVFSVPAKFGKPEIWASGLLYLMMRYHRIAVTQRELAEAFHVSTSSVRKASLKLEETLLQDVKRGQV